MVFLHQFWKWAASEELLCLNIYIYSLQGFNYIDISVSASQSHNAKLVMQNLLPVQSILTSHEGC